MKSLNTGEKLTIISVFLATSWIGWGLFGEKFESILGFFFLIVLLALLFIAIRLFKKPTMKELKSQLKESQRWEAKRQRFITGR
ncbi:MAG TPA: hypothetical protein VF185_04790 [Patescibacteria group bacterium]